MKLIVAIFTAFILAIVTPVEKVYSQTTTVSKRCGKCGKPVSASSKVGDRCPHCGVRWGYENTSTSTSYKTTTSTEPYLDYYNPRTTKPKAATNKTASSTKAETKAKPNPFANYTKEQTETWLLEKLNAYAQKRSYFFDNSYYITEDDYEFKLDGTYLIVKYNYNNSYDEVVYVPLYDYDELSEKYGTFSISTVSPTMYEVNKSTNLKRATSYLTIGFRNDGETNLIEKIDNALKRLKKLYIKPTSSQLPQFISKSEANKPNISETKTWILTKLNNYAERFSYNEGMNVEAATIIDNSSFSFSGDYLVLTRTERYVTNRGSTNYTYKIPYCECTLYITGGNMQQGTLNIISSAKNIVRSSSTNSQDVNKVNIQINFDKEDNLSSRFQKAFNNLKSYCTKHKTNEPF